MTTPSKDKGGPFFVVTKPPGEIAQHSASAARASASVIPGASDTVPNVIRAGSCARSIGAKVTVADTVIAMATADC